MTHQAHVAVVAEAGADFTFRDVAIDDPGPHEVLIRITATGLCHTDLSVRDGNLPAAFPEVLGHEGAGVVEATGSHVTDLKPGDPVVLSYGSCGQCRPCREGDPAYCADFNALNFGNKRQGKDDPVFNDGELSAAFFQQSSFGTLALAHERNVVKVPAEVDLSMLGPLGCGIQTGAGTVLNTLQPRAGSALAVFGAGSVGLAAVMAAKVAGCATIIAVDIQPQRLELAKELGATHTVNSDEVDPVETIREITGDALDFAVECSGISAVARQAQESLGKRGTMAIVGAPPGETDYSFDANTVLLSGHKIVGAVEGDSVVQVFIPRLIDLWQQGRFPFDKLVTKYPFDQINQAVEDMESGKVIKPILTMPG